MEWTDEAIVLGSRRQGEANAVVEVMTRAHGRHSGLVRGARGKRLSPVLQPGNVLGVTWRARLDEHLGYFQVEPTRTRAADYLASPVALAAVQTLAAHLRLLPDRDPHPELYEALDTVLDHLLDPAEAGEVMVRFELLVLEALGVGLDLAACALTGSTEDLAWVSPKTGRAASRVAGAAYADRLLPLPAFLAPARGTNHPPLAAVDVAAGLRLTGHFLARHVWEPRGLAPPMSRDMLAEALARTLPG